MIKDIPMIRSSHKAWLLLLAYCLATAAATAPQVTSARYSIREGTVDELHTTSQVAFLTFEFDQSVYLDAYSLCNNGVELQSTTTSNASTCCMPCPDSTPNCWCPADSGATCIGSGDLVSSQVTFGSKRSYGLAVPNHKGCVATMNTQCDPLIIQLQTVMGDADMTATLMAIDPAEPSVSRQLMQWTSAMWMDDVIVVCPSNLVTDAPYQLVMVIDVTTTTPTTSFTLTTTYGKRVPVSAAYHKASFEVHIDSVPSCTISANTLNCPAQSIPVEFLPSSPDPFFSYYGRLRHTVTDNTPNTISFMLQLSKDIIVYDTQITTQFYFAEEQLRSMKFAFPSIVNQNGEAVEGEYLTQEYVPYCSTDYFSVISSRFMAAVNSMMSMTSDRLSDENIKRAYTQLNAYVMSDHFYGCKLMVERQLLSGSSTQSNSTECTKVLGTPEYGTDPCCNQTLGWFQPCIPRAVDTQQMKINADAVQDKCQSPTCTTQYLSNFLEIQNNFNSDLVLCTSDARTLLNTMDYSTDIMIACWNRVYGKDCSAGCDAGSYCNYTTNRCSVPCTADSDCEESCDMESGMCTASNPELALVNCLRKNADIVSMGIMRDEWELPPNTQDNLFATEFHARLLDYDCLSLGGVTSAVDWPTCQKEVHCNWGMCHNGTGAIVPDDDPAYGALCEQSCTENVVQSPYFCSDTYRNEVSSFGTCTREYPRVEFQQINCTADGGQWNYITNSCVFPTIHTQQDCLQATYCSSENIQTDGAVSSCNAYCYRKVYKWQCDCPSCRWMDSVQLCAVTDAQDQNQCVYNSTLNWQNANRWFPGFTWAAPWLDTKEQCQSYGYCDLGPKPRTTNVTRSQCEQSWYCTELCSYGFCLSEKECSLNTGHCDDEELINPYDPTVTAVCLVSGFQVSSSGDLSCENGLHLTRLGCADLNIVDQSACRNYPGSNGYPRWEPRATSMMACYDHGVGCMEPSGVLTSKSETDCKIVGGTTQPFYSWISGKWAHGTWTPYVWYQRSIESNNKWVPYVKMDAWNAAYTNASVVRLGSALTTSSLCRYNPVMQNLLHVSCDCTETVDEMEDHEDCYLAQDASSSGVFKVCSNVPVVYEAKPAEIYTYNFTVIQEGCTDMTVETFPIIKVQQRHTMPVLSDFRSVLVSENPYAVVRNEHNIVVGQLRGDGVNVKLFGNVTDGVVSVCVHANPNIEVDPLFTEPGFVVSNEEMEEFTPLPYRSFTYEDLICINVKNPFADSIIFPAFLRINSNAVNFFDMVSTSTKVFFYVGGGLFFLALVGAVTVLGFNLTSRQDMLVRGILGTLCVTLVLRIVYFCMLPTGDISSPSANILLSLIPTYLFLFLFSVTVLYWIKVYYCTNNMRATSAYERMRPFIYGASGFIWLIIIISIIAYPAGYDEHEQFVTACDQDPESSQAKTGLDVMTEVFHVILATCLGLAAISFVFYGGSLMVHLRGHGARIPDIPQYYLTTILMIISTACLVIEWVMVLISTFSDVVPSVSVLQAVFVVEIIPTIIMIFLASQPTFKLGVFAHLKDMKDPTTQVTELKKVQLQTTNAPSDSPTMSANR